jgi:hypothetical protein
MFSSGFSKVHQFAARSVAIWRKAGAFVVISVAVLALASCAMSPNGDGASGTRSADSERDIVSARVQARWDALIRGDLDAAYAFLSPGSKQAISLERFKSITRKGGFRSITIDRIECTPGKCDVRLTLVYDRPPLMGLHTIVDESWIFENGQAWYVDRR